LFRNMMFSAKQDRFIHLRDFFGFLSQPHIDQRFSGYPLFVCKQG
jgi:hypothetical protein